MIIKPRNKSPKKLLLTLGVVVIIIFLGWLYYAHHSQKWPFLPPAGIDTPTSVIDYGPAKSDQVKAGNSIKEQLAGQAETSPQSSSSSTQQPSTIAMDITAANKTDSTLTLRALIQKVTSMGTCTLTMSGANGGSYTATASVQAMASTSTCRGFNVPLSDLPHGIWQVTIKFTDGADTGSTSREVTL